ncbi:hypothetical protein GUJ93_ZPchr0012g20769, partial [Zizania palustris]
YHAWKWFAKICYAYVSSCTYEEIPQSHCYKGTYNFTSTQPPQHLVMTQLDNTTDIGDTEATFLDIEETFAYQVQDNVGARVDSFEEVENIGSNEHRAERVMEP